MVQGWVAPLVGRPPSPPPIGGELGGGEVLAIATFAIKIQLHRHLI